MIKSSGKIIKKDSNLSKLVKNINIFKENLDKVVKNIDMEYVGDNSKEIKPVFNPQEIFEKALNKINKSELIDKINKDSETKSKTIKKEVENPYLKTIKKLETEKNNLKQEIESKDKEIEYLKKQMEDLKNSSEKMDMIWDIKKVCQKQVSK